MDDARLAEIFSSVGLYEPFDCADCRARDVFVSGRHSHVCARCGGLAHWGFYAPTPLCDPCHVRLGPLSHWEPLPKPE